MIKSKKIVTLVIGILLVISSMSFTSFATTTTENTLTDTLTLTSDANASGDGYIWTASTKTLEITSDGLTIEATDSSENGIVLPAGSTIEINGELNVTAYKYAIYSKGDITIVANADSNITSWSYESIRAEGGKVDITVATGVTMNVTGYTAIYAFSGATDKTYVDITVDGSLNLYGDSNGIRSQGTVTLKGTGEIYILGNSSPIYAGVDTSSLSNVYLGETNSDTLTISFGQIISSTYSSSFNISNYVTINGLISYANEEIVYGAYTANTSLSLSGNGNNNLKFDSDSIVTIDEDVYIYLTSYASVDYTNAKFVNNGVLVLSDDAPDISTLDITGSGFVVITEDSGLDYYYDNNGVFQYVRGNVYLSTTEERNDLYNWTESDGVYTLELFSGVDYEEISFYIEVDSAIITLTGDVEVDGISFNQTNTGTDLTIMGNFTLTCPYIEGDGSLTISEGTTLVTEEFYMYSFSDFTALHDLVISGTLKVTGEMYIGSLEVTNTGYLYLDGYFASISLAEIAPTVTLGDQIKIISPEDAYYFIELWEDYYYIGTFLTIDDEEVTELIIGLKPSYDVTVTITGDGEVTTEDESFAIMEGFDKKFTFIPADNYEIYNVIIDGVSCGAIESFTFEDVTEEHTIEIEFTEIEINSNNSDASTDDEDIVVQTGDNNSPRTLIALIFVSSLGIFLVGKKTSC